ncbi:serine hydroxymethyltransferase, partial [Candidatus Aerophobetes bacterium]|nr:serine hydroxymethyltransferase [Candidatus Aerophobetes bacterium]
NAKELARALNNEGFRLVSGGTDTHLMLVDLSNNGITGNKAAAILERAGIVVNYNSIPFDTQSPPLTSGIRPGTPALTTRGMKEPEMKLIGEWISKILHNPEDSNLRKKIKRDVEELCKEFPIYEELSL